MLGLALLAAEAEAKDPPLSKKQQKRRDAKLSKVSRKLNVPVAALRQVGGHRYGARKVELRRALMKAIVAKPLADLAPLVVAVALRERDLPCRFTAVKLLSVVGLEADRVVYLKTIHPALPRLYRARYEQVWKDASLQTNHLVRWFDLDREVVDLLERTFDGKHYRLAQRSFYGLMDLKNPALREGVALRALEQVLHPRTRFGVFERKRAVKENGLRGEPWDAKRLGELMLADGTVAIESAQALGRLGDPRGLPSLRRIDRTASHKLRIPALRARARLGDLQLLSALPKTLESDHPAIQRALIESFADLEHRKVDRVLRRLSKRLTDPALLRSVALTRLRRGDGGDAARLRKELEGATPNVGLANQVLGIEHAAAAPLIEIIAANAAVSIAGPRLRAVARLGSMDSKANRALLRKLQTGNSDLRLHAAVSLLELGAKDGAKLVRAALEDLNIVRRSDVKTDLGVARRYKNSPLSRDLRRLARNKRVGAAPMIARWLDPPDPKPTKPLAKKTTKPDESTRSRVDEQPKSARPKRPAPKLPKWLRHQFVRRTAVEVLGDLSREMATRLASGKLAKKERSRLEARQDQAIAALTRCLDDPRGVVVRAAVRALARLAGDDLPPGASLKEEQEVREVVEAWLSKRS